MPLRAAQSSSQSPPILLTAKQWLPGRTKQQPRTADLMGPQRLEVVRATFGR